MALASGALEMVKSPYLYDYQMSIKLGDTPFYALIMAAMRRADTDNLAKLQACWPEIWSELQRLYNTPGALEEGR